MKVTPILLGISLAVTTLGVGLSNPARAGHIEAYPANRVPVRTATVKKKKCFLKRFYVPAQRKHGVFIPAQYVTKKVCEFVIVKH
jgi:hypothetical protein